MRQEAGGFYRGSKEKCSKNLAASMYILNVVLVNCILSYLESYLLSLTDRPTEGGGQWDNGDFNQRPYPKTDSNITAD